MRIAIELPEALLNEAMKLAHARTKTWRDCHIILAELIPYLKIKKQTGVPAPLPRSH